MIGLDQRGDRAQSIDLAKGWLRVMRDEGFADRVADVGAPVLSTVTILSVVEAARINRIFRQNASEALQQRQQQQEGNDFGRHLCLGDLRCAEAVDELLGKLGTLSYFSPWIIVETADID
jgi:hypothetical protein